MDPEPEEELFTTKLTLAYDGTRYSGWQIQPNGLSIQEILQEKLAILIKRSETVIGAGRTDAGVHALGQIAHFRHSDPIDHFKLVASLNGLLPRDIRVKKAESAPRSFHARHSAINKAYHYHLNLGPVQDPFLRLYSWYIPERMNIELLIASAKQFLGTHDFTSFANEAHLGSAAKNPVRTITRLEVIPEREGYRIEFEAQSFLYKMVRNITGMMIEIAIGKRQIEEVPEIFAAKDRRRAGRAAPPQGLFLMQVDYPSEFSGSDKKEGK